MSICRRNFLKLSGLAVAATAFGGLGFDLKPTVARAQQFKLQNTKQTTTICPYCSVGCGLIVSTAQGGAARTVNVEGDPDHPTNEGSLCAKGSSIFQLAENNKRVLQPMYRAPGSAKWEPKSWDWMIKTIAQRVKATRDATFETKDEKGNVVNRCEGMASVGSAALDNEELFVYQAMLRTLGLTYIEHQARI